MIFILYSLFILLCAAIPALMVLRNLSQFQRAPNAARTDSKLPPLSVLIPARNEEANIESSLRSILATDYPDFEVVVLNDNSEDQTADIVQRLIAEFPPLRLENSDALPDGWNGKQFACWQLANLARNDYLLFLDADVRISSDCLSRVVTEAEQTKTELLSGFPRQETGSIGERLMIPMMHYVLLSYLPLDQMRASTEPEFGAGCGQMFLAKREPYFACGGHQSIANSRHDGLKLPRAFRSSGYMSDLFDASDVATVRMYNGWKDTFFGLLKNATEGIANSKLIVLFTALLFCGSIAPILSSSHAIYHSWPLIDTARLIATVLLVIATVLSFLPAFWIAARVGYSKWCCWLHPLSTLLFLVAQWTAFLRDKMGKGPVEWKGRS